MEGADNKFEDIIDGDCGIDLGEEDEDFEIKACGEDEGDDKFDMYVGVLQDVLLDPKFELMCKDFSHKYCMEFEATEENKLCYMSIFKEYQCTIEGYLMNRLEQEITDFSMEYFSSELHTRKDEIDEQIMDLLLSFSDFTQFKEMMIFERAHFVATTPKPKSSKAAKLGLKDSVAELKNPEIKLEGNKANQSELKYFENCIDGLQVSGKATQVY